MQLKYAVSRNEAAFEKVKNGLLEMQRADKDFIRELLECLYSAKKALQA
jgi:hypothetical protein